MKIRTLLAALGLALLLPLSALAQTEPDPSTNIRQITSATSGDIVLGPLTSRGTVTIQLYGTWVGTFPIQASLSRDCTTGGTYATLPGTSSLTANGLTQVSAGGVRCIKIPASGWSSGTVNVIMQASGTGGGSGTISTSGLATQDTAEEISSNTGAVAAAKNLAGDALRVDVIKANGSTLIVDPCQGNTKLYFSINTAADARIITNTAGGKKIYLCNLWFNSGTAQTISFFSGTGSVCVTGSTAVKGLDGATAAANGTSIAANGGVPLGNGGYAIAQVQNANDDLCIDMNGSNRVIGGGSYVEQ